MHLNKTHTKINIASHKYKNAGNGPNASNMYA